MAPLYRYRVPLAILLYAGCFLLLYPWYRYVLDDDGIGYAMVTKRLAAGDYATAINGYWSPLHSWIALPFYKAGLSLVAAFKVSNLCIASALLYVVDKLMYRVALTEKMKAILLVICIPVLLYMGFYQLAADILFCLFFCAYLVLCGSPTAFTRTTTVAACALLGVLAYLSKTYGFPLFIAHFTVWQGWLYKRSLLPRRKWQLIKNWSVGMGVFVLLSLPWMRALYEKYDRVTIGYSGRINLAWQLAPGSSNSSDTSFFSVPPYADSPTPWEDPGYPQQVSVSPFASTALFSKQVKLVLHNCLAAVQALYTLSFLAPAILLAMFLYAMRTGSSMLLLLLLSVVLLPGGYLPVHIEPRFLWAAIFLLLIGGTYLLSRIFYTWRFRIAAQNITWIVFFSSFLVTPLNALQDLRGANQQEHAIAAALKRDGISGKFASAGVAYSSMRKIAFLSGNRYYENHRTNYAEEAVLAGMKSEKINYYFFFYETTLDAFRHSPIYTAAFRRIDYPQYNLLILHMNKDTATIP